MNQAVYMAFLEPGDTVLAMDLSHGGHLTHGAPVSHMGKIFRFVRYKTDSARAGAIDFDQVRALALEHRPKIVLCGHSSYPRDYDYAAFRRIAEEVGALTMADVSHIGGLIAGGALRNPLDDGFDVVTTTTHKSLRGPRGGMILCRAQHAQAIDKAVFPGLQGGPHMNAVAGIAVTLGKALEPAFRDYCRKVLDNAKTLAEELVRRGAELVTGGTENHLMVVVTTGAYGIDGKVAEQTLDEVSITVNKQIVPDDPRPPLRPSGIRLGTPAATTRGMGAAEMTQLAGWIHDALSHHQDRGRLERVRAEVEELCLGLPVPGL
jgi:glycine hydroxymethyltransferase